MFETTDKFKVGDVLAIEIITMKDKVVLANAFVNYDHFVSDLKIPTNNHRDISFFRDDIRHRSVRVFKASDVKGKVGEMWRCKVTAIHPINPTRETKDGRLFVYVDVEMVEPIVKERFLDYLPHGIKIQRICGSVRELSALIPVTVKGVWFKYRGVEVEPKVYKANYYYSGEKLLAVSTEVLPIGREKFIEAERRGVEDLLSAQSVSARFDKCEFLPEGVPELDRDWDRILTRRYA